MQNYKIIVQVPEVPISQIVVQKTGIQWSNNKLWLGAGDTYQLNCTLIPEKTSQRKLLYTSSNPELLPISDDGLIRTVGGLMEYASTYKFTITIKSASNPNISENITVFVGRAQGNE